jgi:hypothetical protein
MWSGNINDGRVLEVVSNTVPEILLLRPFQYDDPEWKGILTNRYVSRGDYGTGRLFVHQSLAPATHEPAVSFLKRHHL